MVGIGTDWARVSAGARHTCALRLDQTLWCWGSNVFGQLGLGDVTDRLVPTQV
jgi:alpha-tubulin suppressor-like RCC1 family protein